MEPERYPHCDQRVLHRPGACIYCDSCPERQQEREQNKVNFTGESDPGKAPCPADAARGLGNAHRWHGNAPRTKEQLEAENQRWLKEMGRLVRGLTEKLCPRCKTKETRFSGTALVCPDCGNVGGI